MPPFFCSSRTMAGLRPVELRSGRRPSGRRPQTQPKKAVAELKSRTWLDLGAYSPLTDEGVQALAEVKALTNLNLWGRSLVTDQAAPGTRRKPHRTNGEGGTHRHSSNAAEACPVHTDATPTPAAPMTCPSPHGPLADTLTSIPARCSPHRIVEQVLVSVRQAGVG